MTNKHYKGNEMIRRLVIGADFVILNIVLLFYTQYGQELIPAYFDKATKITFFVANAALFLGEYFYSTIIHVRKIGFLQVTKRTLYLAAATTFCFFTFSRLLGRRVCHKSGCWRITVDHRMHITCCACAYQLLCKRTTAVVRPKIQTASTTYPISSNNIFLLIQQHILALQTTRKGRTAASA